MKVYEYKCLNCETRRTSDVRGDKVFLNCDQCGYGVVHQRVWSVAVKPMMHAHLNSTTGTVVSDFNQFKTELRIKGEIAEERTGIPHKYEPLEYGDHAAFGATGEGIYESNVERSRRGEPLLPLIE